MNDMNRMLFNGYYNVELISNKLTKKVMKFTYALPMKMQRQYGMRLLRQGKNLV